MTSAAQTRQRRPLAAALALLLAYGGPPALAASDFDGTYRGTWHVTLNNNTAACGRAERPDATLTIRQNRFTVIWAGERIEGSVDPDGNVTAGNLQADHYTYNRAGRSATFHLRGRIVDGVLDAQGGGPACQVHLSMRKA
jgi:hypothetical protein